MDPFVGDRSEGSGFLAFIVGVANYVEAWKKNRLEMEQSKVKLQLEIMKAYREVLKEVREMEKHNWGREEEEEEGRESRQVDWRPATYLNSWFAWKRHQYEQNLAEKKDKREEDAEIREINAQLRAINSLRRLGQVDRTVKRIRLQRSSETAAP
ncbi:unnamed protein product [Clonostachys chloroleuca]|uniref:Uncharacterized protein n=1 Tax=Clonostachys chloroleuca TaxID=1926264 RepID=A0AA35VQH8_9HYPO|nr:unnamed protein product [Clonostachys chloroleuca]